MVIEQLKNMHARFKFNQNLVRLVSLSEVRPKNLVEALELRKKIRVLRSYIKRREYILTKKGIFTPYMGERMQFVFNITNRHTIRLGRYIAERAPRKQYEEDSQRWLP